MDSQSQLPLISCICITDNRGEMLFKSILSFEQQNYPHKELIISYPSNDDTTVKLIQYFSNKSGISIKSIKREKNETIGLARNTAITIAKGEYVCMWDDDDLYDYTRLWTQFNAIKSSDLPFEASVLSQILLYHKFDRTAYLSFPSYWACTLLCKKDLCKKYPCLDADQFEYSEIINFLVSNKLLCSISNPSIYISVFHGKNLIRYSTFLFLVNQSEKIPIELSANIKEHVEWQIKIPEVIN